MRPILRSPAVVLLLILAIPLPVIALERSGALGLVASWALYIVSLAACVVGLAVLLLLGIVRRPKRGQPIDQRSNERYLGTLVLGLAVAIDSLAFSTTLTVYLTAVAGAAIWVLLWLPRSMRVVATRSSVVIQRDPAVVFAYAADFENDPKFIPGVESTEKISSGPIGQGSQYHVRVRIGQRTFDAVAEIVDYEPNQRVTSRVVSVTTPNFDILTIEPAHGGTLLSHRYDSVLSYNQALLGASLLRWFLTRRLLAMRRTAWARLKQILESGEAGT